MIRKTKVIFVKASKRIYIKVFILEILLGGICPPGKFLRSITGINTQVVKFFNNELNLSIKCSKRVLTCKRHKFLYEF